MSPSPRIHAFVFARGGSKGVPGKNLRPLGGLPLVARSVRFGLDHPRIDRVIVSTDDQAIAEAARQAGGEVPFLRPAELATDTAVEHLAWQHAIREVFGNEPGFDVFVSLPPTCPLRAAEDVSRALDRFLEGGADTVVCVTEARSHPSFTIVRQDQSGLIERCVPLPGITRRQDAPPAFDLTAVCFVSSPRFILDSGHYFEGRVAAVTVPPERAVDIDTETDLAFAEFLYQRGRQRP